MLPTKSCPASSGAELFPSPRRRLLQLGTADKTSVILVTPDHIVDSDQTMITGKAVVLAKGLDVVFL